MRRIKLFGFPEFLLLISILWQFVRVIIAAHMGADLTMYSAFYFERHQHAIWGLFGLPVVWALSISWILHVVIRAFGLMSSFYRWLHVGVTIGLMAANGVFFYLSFHGNSNGPPGWYANTYYLRGYIRSVRAFNLIQLAFWITTVLLLIIAFARYRKQPVVLPK